MHGSGKWFKTMGPAAGSNEVADPASWFSNQKKAMVRSSSKKNTPGQKPSVSLQRPAMIYLPQKEKHLKTSLVSQNPPPFSTVCNIQNLDMTFHDILIGSWRDPCFTAYFNPYIRRPKYSSSPQKFSHPVWLYVIPPYCIFPTATILPRFQDFTGDLTWRWPQSSFNSCNFGSSLKNSMGNAPDEVGRRSHVRW